MLVRWWHGSLTRETHPERNRNATRVGACGRTCRNTRFAFFVGSAAHGRWKRLKIGGDVLGAVLGHACAINPGPDGTLTVTLDAGPSEMDNEAHASIRSTRKLRRPAGCRWVDVVQKRWELAPYDVHGVVVDAAEGPACVGAVADLRTIVQTMVQCARLEGQVRAEADMLVIIAYDATPFHKTSATRC